jgi:hypothetical protein
MLGPPPLCRGPALACSPGRPTPTGRLQSLSGAIAANALALVASLALTYTRPPSRALQKILFFRFFNPGPGGPGGPRELPLSHPWAFPGPPGDLRQTKAKNLKELTERWSCPYLETALPPVRQPCLRPFRPRPDVPALQPAARCTLCYAIMLKAHKRLAR